MANLDLAWFHLTLVRGFDVDPRLSAAMTVVLVASLRIGSVHFGLKAHAARGFVEAAELTDHRPAL